MIEMQKGELRDQFLGNIDSWLGEMGITETQIPIIDRLIDVIIETSKRPEQVIKTATRAKILGGIRYEDDFWLSLRSLMRQAEILSGQKWIYTPSDFVETMRPFADDRRQKYSERAPVKKTSIDTQSVMSIADECVNDQEFVLDFLANSFLPRANYEDNLEHYTNPKVARRLARENQRHANISYRYILKRDNAGELHGMMRSISYCGQASQFLFQALEPHFSDNTTLLWADGRLSPYFYQHYVVMITPNDFWPENKKPKDVKSEYLVRGEHSFEFGSMVVIDSAILQAFGHNAFLRNIPYKERVPFIRTIAPDLFSDTGIFVGNFVEYIHLVNLLGLTDPEFDLNTSLPEYIHP